MNKRYFLALVLLLSVPLFLVSCGGGKKKSTAHNTIRGDKKVDINEAPLSEASNPTGDLLDSYYLDSDGDGYGDNNKPLNSKQMPDWYVANNTDCNDSDPSVYPDNATPEWTDSEKDLNCDGSYLDLPSSFTLTLYDFSQSGDPIGSIEFQTDYDETKHLIRFAGAITSDETTIGSVFSEFTFDSYGHIQRQKLNVILADVSIKQLVVDYSYLVVDHVFEGEKRMVKEIVTSDGNSVTKNKFTYRFNGPTIHAGKLSSITSEQYGPEKDPAGSGSDGSLLHKSTTNESIYYNANEQISSLKTSVYFTDLDQDSISTEKKFDYDKDGRLISETIVSESLSILKSTAYVYEVDSLTKMELRAGAISKEISIGDLLEFEYDDNDMTTLTHSEFDADGSTSKVEFIEFTGNVPIKKPIHDGYKIFSEHFKSLLSDVKTAFSASQQMQSQN